MTRFTVLSCLCLALTAGCSDYFGEGSDPGKAGLTEGKRLAIVVQNLYVNAIAVDETRLYAATGQGVLSFEKNGTDRHQLSTYNEGPGVLLHWNGVLYARPSSGGIYSLATTGGDALPFVSQSQAQGAGGLAVDASGVYFTSGPEVFRAPLKGGSPQKLASDATNQGGPIGTSIAVDANNVYYTGMVLSTDGPSTSALRALSKTDWGGSVVASSTGTIFAITAGNGHVYYMESVGGGSGGGRLVSVDPSSPSATMLTLDDTIITNGGGDVLMVADATGVYVSAGNGLFRASLDGSGIVPLVQNTKPVSLAVDDTWIYWVDQNSNGVIVKFRK